MLPTWKRSPLMCTQFSGDEMNKYASKHLFSRDPEDLDVNLSKLRTLYKSDYAARQVLDALAARTSDSKGTTVNRIMDLLTGAGHIIQRKDVLRVFEELQKLNCGVLTRGPKRTDSKFHWRVSLVVVGRLAAR